MTFPSPFPTPRLGPFEVSVEKLLNEVLLNVQESRRYRLQPPLVPDNRFLIGQEELGDFVSAPAIFIVPLGARFSQTRGTPEEVSPLKYMSQWLSLECHCWGDDGPPGSSPMYSFSSSLELFRQLMVGLIENNFGPDHVRVISAGYIQNTDRNRQGRMFVGTIEVETFLIKDPPILAPVATATTPGVSTTNNIYIRDPATGTDESAGTIVVPP